MRATRGEAKAAEGAEADWTTRMRCQQGAGRLRRLFTIYELRFTISGNSRAGGAGLRELNIRVQNLELKTKSPP